MESTFDASISIRPAVAWSGRVAIRAAIERQLFASARIGIRVPDFRMFSGVIGIRTNEAAIVYWHSDGVVGISGRVDVTLPGTISIQRKPHNMVARGVVGIV